MINPILATDAYKLDHRRQYPDGTEYVYSNLTARGSRMEDVDYTIFFGLQHFVKNFLIANFQENFFDRDINLVVEEYRHRVDRLLGPNDIGTDHIERLHALGYLPVCIKALPEGTKVPLRVPMMTIENTNPDFFWLTNYLETIISTALWLPITSATQAYRLRRMLQSAADFSSSDPSFVMFQGHDFSMRGLESVEAAAISGAAHLLSFWGSDTLPAMDLLEAYYYGDKSDVVGLSVAATEHSVMSAGGEMNETETFDRLLGLYPQGIVSVVSDTWDLWNVLTDILPVLKDTILSRDGRLVIRPDSGDPANILCGDPSAKAGSPASRGVIQLLWDTFGGTTNIKGYKELNPKVGAIYGDSITYDRARNISRRLMEAGFASTNVVLGVGSFTYQYVTRDTFGMAMKATWCQVNGEARDLYKDPVTDSGLKRSATGRLSVVKSSQGLELIERATPDQELESELVEVFVNGNLVDEYTLEDIRNRMHP